MNIITIKDNKYCKIELEEKSIFNSLKKYLSFKKEGVIFSPAYKRGWDGITYLLNNDGTFLIGLLDRVVNFLNNKKVEVSINDLRSSQLETTKPLDISKKLDDLKMVPRDYQLRILEASKNNDRGIVRACTGSGKTLCTALITATYNKPTIIYVIGLDLLGQFYDLFSKIFDEPIGYIGDGKCEIHRINIASIWTIGRSLKGNKNIFIDDEIEKEVEPSKEQQYKIKKMLSTSHIHIFDESHVVTTDTIKSIYDCINPEKLYGFSGTPFRDDNSNLLIEGILGKQIVNVPAAELIAKNFLSKPYIKFVRVPKTYESTNNNNYRVVYSEYIINNKIRNNIIIEETKKLLDKNYQTLVLFKNISHGKILSELLDNNNIPHEMLNGKNSLEERNEIKNKCLSGECKLVLASTIFDIGVDISSLSGLILVGGGKSSIRALQRIGRVIRKFDGKNKSAIVDFFDDVKFLKKHSKIRYKIYSSEDGFTILLPSNLKSELN